MIIIMSIFIISIDETRYYLLVMGSFLEVHLILDFPETPEIMVEMSLSFRKHLT